MNFKKYRKPGRTERLKSSLDLHFTNSLLYGAFNKLLGPWSGEITGDLTPIQCLIPRYVPAAGGAEFQITAA